MTKRKPEYFRNYRPITINWFTGWWFQPLWKIWVSWDYYSQYMEKNAKCSKPPTSLKLFKCKRENEKFLTFGRDLAMLWGVISQGPPAIATAARKKCEAGAKELCLWTLGHWVPIFFNRLVGNFNPGTRKPGISPKRCRGDFLYICSLQPILGKLQWLYVVITVGIGNWNFKILYEFRCSPNGAMAGRNHFIPSPSRKELDSVSLVCPVRITLGNVPKNYRVSPDICGVAARGFWCPKLRCSDGLCMSIGTGWTGKTFKIMRWNNCLKPPSLHLNHDWNQVPWQLDRSTRFHEKVQTTVMSSFDKPS